MDNPQHYQPLSHALHAPQASAIQTQATYTVTGMYNPKSVPAPSTRREEEEEEEEEDDDDEGLVEQQLSRNEPDAQGSNPSSPPTKPTGSADVRSSQTQQPVQVEQTSQEPDRKRRPGRPRGSKNRKPRVGQTISKQEPPFYYQGHPSLHPAAGSTPPQHPDVNAHNQQYYEFQWRVLNLCAEFYGAAEELVKGTPPLVIAQCYQMGPSNKVDPLIMLGDAKRICDTLLANPTQLISTPPPPIYTAIPTMYPPQGPPQAASATTTSISATTSTSKAASSPATTVISNPQSFVVSLSAPQSGYPHAQYSMYAPPAGQYPTTPYYHQYTTYAPPGATYYAQQPQPQPQSAVQTTAPAPSSSPSQPSSAPGSAAPTTTMTSPGTGIGGNQGTWSDEETEKLRKLAEDSRSVGTSGEMEWDWVVHQWGNSRTRHQILIKATSLGLKESSSRGIKRRRDTEGGVSDAASPSVPPTPTLAGNTSTSISAPTSASPAHSQAASTPTASPALPHQQRPLPSSKPHSSVSSNPTTSLPWPMPTVAANTPSPVVAAATIGQDQQRTSYYRPRPSQADPSSSKPASQTQHATTHQYMYQPNGSAGSASRLAKENGK